MHLVTRLGVGNLFSRLHLAVEHAFIFRSHRMIDAWTEHAVFNGKAAGLLIAARRTPVKDIADNNTFILLAGNLAGIDDDITYAVSAELQEEIVLDLDIALMESKVAVLSPPAVPHIGPLNTQFSNLTFTFPENVTNEQSVNVQFLKV